MWNPFQDSSSKCNYLSHFAWKNHYQNQSFRCSVEYFSVADVSMNLTLESKASLSILDFWPLWHNFGNFLPNFVCSISCSALFSSTVLRHFNPISHSICSMFLTSFWTFLCNFSLSNLNWHKTLFSYFSPSKMQLHHLEENDFESLPCNWWLEGKENTSYLHIWRLQCYLIWRQKIGN